MTIEEAVAKSYELIERAKMCFTPDNLEFLRAGGRVSNAAYIGSKLLSIHPCIEILDGKLTATKKYRGKIKKVVEQMIRDYVEEYNLDRSNLWIVYVTGISDEVKDLAYNTAKSLGFENVQWVPCGGVITTHGGPGAIGIAGFAKE
mgnify:CR=1 FL=1